jgi:hypothetical protein
MCSWNNLWKTAWLASSLVVGTVAFNDDSAEVMEAFQVAIHNVQTVGLSFGGGCFFENGVTTSDGSGTFNSTFTETP